MAMSMPAKAWTLEELHRLPDDGNKYEVIRGELFVTPPPGYPHQEVASRLNKLLVPYLLRHDLGDVHFPRSVVVFEGGQAEPDLMVLPPGTKIDRWERMPAPLLVVEILSRTTARRDRIAKRSYYLDAGAAQYWIVDREARSITVVRRDRSDDVVTDRLRWEPIAGIEALAIELSKVFD